MDWLFENLGKLAPIVIFLLYMISSMKGKGREEEAPDPQAAERARKIQEEIRRKILERQRGSEEPTGRPPVFEEKESVREVVLFDDEPETFEERSQPSPPVRSSPIEERAESAGPEAFMERRRKVEAQLAESKRKRAEALEKAKSLHKGKIGAGSARGMQLESIASGEIRSRLNASLRDRDSLKTAILLKEVLDTPVGMRS